MPCGFSECVSHVLLHNIRGTTSQMACTPVGDVRAGIRPHGWKHHVGKTKVLPFEPRVRHYVEIQVRYIRALAFTRLRPQNSKTQTPNVCFTCVILCRNTTVPPASTERCSTLGPCGTATTSLLEAVTRWCSHRNARTGLQDCEETHWHFVGGRR
jgi:hypothetical protein